MHWVPIGQTVNKEYYVEALREFRKRFLGKRPTLFKSGQWHFHQDNAPVHNFILVTDCLTRMGIKTVPYPPYSPDLAPCDFWLFPKLKEKLRGCRYETIDKMKEAVMKVIGTLTQEDFYGAFQKLLERYNKCIAAGGDYFEGDWSFMCVLSIKCPYEKSLETYLMILVCMRSKRKLYEDNRLVTNLHSPNNAICYEKSSIYSKLDGLSYRSTLFSGFLIFLTLYCFNLLYFHLRI